MKPIWRTLVVLVAVVTGTLGALLLSTPAWAPVDVQQCQQEQGQALQQCCGEQLLACSSSCRGNKACNFHCLDDFDECLNQ